MGLSVLVAPTEWPISVQNAKEHCKKDDADDDSLLQSYIVAATAIIESDTDRTIPETTYRLTLEGWSDEIKLPKPPLVSVTSISYVDSNGATQTLSPNLYYVDTTTPQGRIVLKPNQSWPALGQANYPVTITFIAGYSTSNMPDAAKHIIRLLVSSWNENREAVTDTSLSVVPMAVDALLDTLRWGSYP